MSTPYGPAIETPDDWNAQLSCCCGMPACPVPTMVCESVTADGSYYGYNTGTDPLFYTATRQTYDGGGVFLYTYVQPQISGWINGVKFTPASDIIVTNPGGEDYSGGITTTYEGGVTLEAARLAVVALLLSEMEDADYTGSACYSDRTDLHASLWDSRTYITHGRFRFQIPDTHTGNIYQFTYDLLFTPTTGSPSLLEEDETLEWNAVGSPPDPADPDDDYWFTDYVEIPIPETPGTVSVVNIRYACYPNSPYGFKPQTMGTSYP